MSTIFAKAQTELETDADAIGEYVGNVVDCIQEKKIKVATHYIACIEDCIADMKHQIRRLERAAA